jgi:hypothetical protein
MRSQSTAGYNIEGLDHEAGQVVGVPGKMDQSPRIGTLARFYRQVMRFHIVPKLIAQFGPIRDAATPSRVAKFLIVLLVLVGAVYLNRCGILPLGHATAVVANIQQETGLAYLAPTNHTELSAHEMPSPAQVLENGRPLPGPANSLHEEIRQLGHGRFSFWHGYVYFSVPDASDPRTNGRLYEIQFPRIVSIRAAFCLYVLTGMTLMVAGWQAVREKRQREEIKNAARHWSLLLGKLSFPVAAAI